MDNNRQPSSLNFNSILLTIVLGLSAFTLNAVYAQSALSATQAEKLRQHDSELTDLRQRIVAEEAAITDLRIRYANEFPTK